MKELEKTKRISIAAVLTILLFIIVLLTYKRPEYLYAQNINESLENLTEQQYLIAQNDLANINYVLVDIRSQIEYDKGHLENAINIYAPQILESENYSQIKDFNENSKTIVLYGAEPNEALAPFMVLNQLGVKDLKILKSKLEYNQDELVVKTAEIELNRYDVKQFIAESIKKAEAKPKPKPKPKPVVKKIIPKKKKKKMPVEGGC